VTLRQQLHHKTRNSYIKTVLRIPNTPGSTGMQNYLT